MNNTPVADEPHGREEDYELDATALALDLPPPLESNDDYCDEESDDEACNYEYNGGVDLNYIAFCNGQRAVVSHLVCSGMLFDAGDTLRQSRRIPSAKSTLYRTCYDYLTDSCSEDESDLDVFADKDKNGSN